MYPNSEAKKKDEILVLEDFLSKYKEYKEYVTSATDEEKQTPRYAHRVLIVEGVEKFYPALNDDMKKIIEMRYWYKEYKCDWAEIADELFMKVSRVRKIRDCLIYKFAKTIGWA